MEQIDRARLRAVLGIVGRDQRSLAARVGISESTLSRALRGERTLSRVTSERLARALADAILTGTLDESQEAC